MKGKRPSVHISHLLHISKKKEQKEKIFLLLAPYKIGDWKSKSWKLEFGIPFFLHCTISLITYLLICRNKAVTPVRLCLKCNNVCWGIWSLVTWDSFVLLPTSTLPCVRVLSTLVSPTSFREGAQVTSTVYCHSVDMDTMVLS